VPSYSSIIHLVKYIFTVWRLYLARIHEPLTAAVPENGGGIGDDRRGIDAFARRVGGGAVRRCTVRLNDGFADTSWLENENVQVIRVTEPTRSAVADAFQMSGPRLVVFETSGTIDLGNSNLAITKDKCWVAGQTAPSPGITFIKGAVQIGANDCVVQHIRSRIGPGNGSIQGNDAFNTQDGTQNNVVDHVTASWGRRRVSLRRLRYTEYHGHQLADLRGAVEPLRQRGRPQLRHARRRRRVERDAGGQRLGEVSRPPPAAQGRPTRAPSSSTISPTSSTSRQTPIALPPRASSATSTRG